MGLAADPARLDELVLVDEHDQEVGTATKERVHLEGLLHRAFSVVLWREGNDGVELLLSRRAEGKYHSAGLWANSCCSHPRSDEELLDAADRRVREELGCGVRGLEEIGSFVYRVEFDNGLVEHEFDHVLVGRCVGALSPDPSEASAVRWMEAGRLAEELEREPERFCAWAPRVLRIAMDRLRDEDGCGPCDLDCGGGG
ncbi:MAG: isopentenyl-diphosphate Delta-isomerase [Atopobiaceae bacterium]|nr:isopentenyl-diphosphate Delta-isomerase [Atopobiaceae bacterium]